MATTNQEKEHIKRGLEAAEKVERLTSPVMLRILAVIIGLLAWIAVQFVFIPIHELEESQITTSSGIGELRGLITAKIATLDIQNLSPTDSERAGRQLTQASSVIEAARAGKVRLSTQTTIELSTDLGKAESLHADVPSYWKAVSAVVNYRSALADDFTSSEKPDCFNQVALIGMTESAHQFGFSLDVRDCRIVIDDQEGYSGSKLEQELKLERAFADGAAAAQRTAKWTLTNVDVVFRGGSIILAVDKVIFNNCRFEFELSNPPNLGSRRLAEAVLSATNINFVSTEFEPRSS